MRPGPMASTCCTTSLAMPTLGGSMIITCGRTVTADRPSRMSPRMNRQLDTPLSRQFLSASATALAMIIDPPRVGMAKEVVQQVLAMGPGRIVYVSCNPATLARDLVMLKEGYTVREAQPIDMFPHTFHVESVVCLERK